MKYAGLLVLCTLLGGCLKPDAISNNEPTARLQNMIVEPAFGTNGRTLLYWSHDDGPNALLGQPSAVRFTLRMNGVNRNEDVTAPFDTRLVNDLVELEYRFGKDAIAIIAQHRDTHGRTVQYECFAPPHWECFRQ